MSKIFRKTSLKTITFSISGGARLENVESILISKLNIILNNLYYNRRKYYNKSEDKNEENESVERVLRGFKLDCFEDEFESVHYGECDKIAEFFKRFFVVGAKGNAYRDNITRDDNIAYFTNREYKTEIHRLLDLINSVLEKNDFGKIDYDKLRDVIGEESKMYEFLLILAHNVGNKWENKSKSPFLSTTYGRDAFKTALKFAQHKNKGKYSYIIFAISNDKSKHGFKTVDFDQYLRRLNVEWYDDIHSEKIIKDAIFPHHIIGVFQVDNYSKSKSFIINPYLYRMIETAVKSKCFNYYKLHDYICNYGIQVEQSDFAQFASALGYKSYGLLNEENEVHAGLIGENVSLHLR